jgi:hypothetical protein
MATYLQDIFYDTNKISKNQFKKLMKEAKELSFNWWIDISPEWTREKVDWPFHRAINIFHKTTRKGLHLTVIHRRGFPFEKDTLEIGFSTLGRKSKSGDIFLWIEVDIEHKDYLLDKYALNEKGN